MIDSIEGLHHVTSLASDARANNAFFTDVLGLRRVKTTVNFDAPDVYHLYYGDAAGTPGSVMTYFPFPQAARGRPGAGEVGVTRFAVPPGSLAAWSERLSARGVAGLERAETFGAPELHLSGPDGDAFALVEAEDVAIRGFHSAGLRLRDAGATAELLALMGYEEAARHGDTRRFVLPGGRAANLVDVETLPGAPEARQGAGSVHHLAFAVPDKDRQLLVRKTLVDEGWAVTPPIDRDYFWAIYFRTPGGVLFEIATDEPGFARDEAPGDLGRALKLPHRHEHLRAELERSLVPLEG